MLRTCTHLVYIKSIRITNQIDYVSLTDIFVLLFLCICKVPHWSDGAMPLIIIIII